MIDWLKVRVPLSHRPIRGAGVLVSFDEHGQVEWQKHARVVVGSDVNDRASSDNRVSLASTGPLDSDGYCQELTIDGNITKFFQGHNLWGIDNPVALVVAFLYWLDRFDVSRTVQFAHPFDPSSFDVRSIVCQRIDITHYIDTGSRHNVRCFLDAIAEDGHTKFSRANSVKGTVYLNQNSRRWGVKFYDKYAEAQGRSKGSRVSFAYWLPFCGLPISRTIAQVENLKQSVENLVRCELVLRQNELRDIDKKLLADIDPTALFVDYVGRIKTEATMKLTDSKTDQIPAAVRSTYLLWSQGHDVRSVVSRATYYRHKAILESLGIDISRNCSERRTASVVSLTRFLTSLTAAQVPDHLLSQVFNPAYAA